MHKLLLEFIAALKRFNPTGFGFRRRLSAWLLLLNLVVVVPSASAQEEKSTTVFAIAIVNKKLGNGCVSGELVAKHEVTFKGSWSTAYAAFQKAIYARYPFGSGIEKPYDGFPTTTFVKQGEVAVVVSFTKKWATDKCSSRMYSFAKAATYKQAWSAVESSARENKWMAVELEERWPMPASGNKYAD